MILGGNPLKSEPLPTDKKGMSESNSEFLEDVKHYCGGLVVAPDDLCNEFSVSQCDSCGTRQGGYRYNAGAFDRKLQERLDLVICQDCVMFHANGELPFEE